jgi:hypothetical protein
MTGTLSLASAADSFNKRMNCKEKWWIPPADECEYHRMVLSVIN